MTKYYVPFVNINTFIYEVIGIEPNIYKFAESGTALQSATKDPNFLSSTREDLINFESGDLKVSFQNTIGHGLKLTNNTIPNIASLQSFKNTSFFKELSTTASFFTALNLKRNGPYGYPSWKQIRAHENPLTREQRNRNIITIVAEQNLVLVDSLTSRYSDPKTIETFKEPVFSSRESPLELVHVQGKSLYKTSVEMGSSIKYFENDRLNTLFAPYDFSDTLKTDEGFKLNFLQKTFNLIGGEPSSIVSIKYKQTVFPQSKSLVYNKRVRTNFYHPWKDDSEKRKAIFNVTFAGSTRTVEAKTINYENSSIYHIYRSRWPLDPAKNFLTSTSAREESYIFHIGQNLNQYPGFLQFNGKYQKDLQTKNRNNVNFAKFPGLPQFSYNHTITPLTSCVGPHGMDIEGVNEATLFNDLSIDHIPSGEAYWDAGAQYGSNPFFDSYEEFVHDIKKVGKDYSTLPEFRSSLLFNKLQSKPSETPKEFLEVLGAGDLSPSKAIGFYIGKTNALGTTEIGHVSASSIDRSFFETYSHSDFMRNFDIVQEVSNITNRPLYKMSLTCKGIKKFVPYEGFYPAERTVQIAEKFRDSIIDNCYYTGSGAGNNVGDILTTDADRYVYFNNVMTPMFAPGIMFNSIKSGIAVDYPIHRSSLSLANGGVNIYDDDYYIQKPFDERIPFEALLEPNLYIANKEIHCSEPHPSGNLSGSARWSGTGDTTEYQLMMHNFLAETPNFFLQDQNFSFISSGRSDEVNVQLDSGSVAVLDISLYKSQNKTSKTFTFSSKEFSSYFMTGSGVQETFTMYSRPSAFGPANIVSSSIASTNITSSFSNLGFNWAFTPSYYDGISTVSMVFRPEETRKHSIEEIFNKSVFIENRYSEMENFSGIDSTSDFANVTVLNKNANLGNLGIPGLTESGLRGSDDFHNFHENSISHAKSSLNISLGILKDIDLLDDDTSDTVKVAVDISSDQKSQIIIQPKWETPMFNFQSYSDSDTISLPLVGSQSVPRGIWHQYGAIENDPNKGIFMKIGNPENNFMINNLKDLASVSKIVNLADLLKISTEPVKLGKTASKKVVREAIIAVPFYEYTPGAALVEEERKFLKIPTGLINLALEGKGKPSVVDMVNKMQHFVMPPMFNFLEDKDIEPITMYIFDFKHTFDQEDLGAIWQNLPPKLMTNFKIEEKTISHTFEEDELLSLAALEEAALGGNPQLIMKKMKWMVFKVKQKAEQNYYNKIVGETQTLNKISPYSHNWPYDYFSLVELAKIDAGVIYADTPPDIPIEGPDINSITIPEIGSVTLPSTAQPVPKTSTKRREMIGKETVSKTKLNNKASTSAPSKKSSVSPRKKPTPSLPKTNPVTGNKAKAISKPPKTRENSSIKTKSKGSNNIIPETKADRKTTPKSTQDILDRKTSIQPAKKTQDRKTSIKPAKKAQDKSYTRSVSRGKKK